MKSKLSSKIGILFLCILCVQMISLVVFAATSLPEGLTGNGGTWNPENDTYSVTATGTSGCNASSGKASMTLQNTSGKDAVFSFTYNENTGKDDTPTYSVNSDVTDDPTLTSGKRYSLNMAAGETLEFTVTTNKGNYTSSIVLSEISFKTVQLINIQLQPATNGSYTVTYNNTTETVIQNTTISVNNAVGATLSATPASGYAFVGWRDVATGKLLSNEATYIEKSARTVKPEFISSAVTPAFQIKDGGIHYYLNDALAEVGNSGTIIVVADATVSAGNYTIPSGVTLLIPYSDDNLFRGVPKEYSFDDMSMSNDRGFPDPPEISIISAKTYKSVSSTEYCRLSMMAGANIIVDGELEVSGQTHPLAAGQLGAYGLIQMALGSNISVNNGGILYVWGYIRGEGTVLANPGATVYEQFDCLDYPAAGAGGMNDLNSAGVFAMRDYSLNNIEVVTTYKAGAKLKIYLVVTGYQIGTNAFIRTLIGDDTNALFYLKSNDITKSYVNGRQHFVISGDCSINKFSISMSFLIINYKLDSSQTSGLPFGHSWDLTVDDGGILTLNNSVVMYAGSTLTVAKGGKLIVPSEIKTYVLDANSDPSSINNHATVDVNGEIQVDGAFYTSKYSEDVYVSVSSSEGTGKIYINNIGTDNSVAIRGTGDNSASCNVTPGKLCNSDKSIVETGNGGVNIYDYINGFWRCQNHSGITTDHICDICGFIVEHTEVTDAAVAPSCTETGLTEGSHCSVCGEVLEEQKVISALGHTEVTDAAVTPTCTETGLTEGKHCSVCSEVLVAQEEVAALGHTEVVDAAVTPTCTETGLTEGKHCSVCNEVLVAQEEVAALGHTEVVDAAVAPTCTETGLTEGKHCSICNEVLVAQTSISALGHTPVPEQKPTCTEPGLTAGGTCTVCGEVLDPQEVIPALGHTEVIDESVAPTCTEPGLTQGKHCSVCDEVLVAQEEVAALGHTETIDEAVAPTCTETGLTEGKHCSVCNTVLVAQEEVAALGHTEVIDAAVAPTCVKDGLTEGKHCSVCNEILVAQEVDPALGESHEYATTGSVACDKCGAEASITEKGRTLSYQDYIYVVDIFELNNMEGVVTPGTDAGLIVWTSNPGENYCIDPTGVTENDQNIDVNEGLYGYGDLGAENVTGSENFYFGVTDGIYTRDLHKSIYMAAYVLLPNGTYVYSDLLEYSPSAYAYNMIKSKDVSIGAATKDLCVALLNYISEAQLYFNANTPVADLVNAGLAGIDPNLKEMGELTNLQTKPKVDKQPANQSVEVFTGTGQNLLFEDMISLGALYKIKDETVEEAKQCYTVFWTEEQFAALQGVPSIDNLGEHTKSDMISYKGISGQWVSLAPKIAAKDMADTVYYFMGVVIDKDGKVAYSQVLSYTIEEYVNEMMGDTTMGNFAKRLYFYERAARAALKPDAPALKTEEEQQ